MRIKYYNPLESYKEKQSAFPGDKIGRKERKHNESQLITDDDGNITYKEHITKEEIKNAITGESVYDETPDYDYEKEILDAINNDPDEEDIIA